MVDDTEAPGWASLPCTMIALDLTAELAFLRLQVAGFAFLTPRPGVE